MTKPTVGVTHDVVLFVNNSQACGLSLKPFTYHVQFAPTFIPRFSIGDAKGIDRSRWRSWIQSRFDGGAGQFYWSSSAPTNKFAESHLVDIGFPTTRRKEMVGLVTPAQINVNVNVQDDLDDAASGDISAASLPWATTAGYDKAHSLFSWPAGIPGNLLQPYHMVEMSNRPHIVAPQAMLVYTGVDNPAYYWDYGALSLRSNRLTGKWAVCYTGAESRAFDAVMYSGVAVMAGKLSGSGMYIYGARSSMGAVTASVAAFGPAIKYIPEYATHATALAVYDNKLWKSRFGKASYLLATETTNLAQWSDYTVGDPDVPINKMERFNGKLYFGKEDALWVYDQGLIYEVQDFRDERDQTNFRMMVSHQGALYFNIRAKVYRLTTAGTLELLQTPLAQGAIMSGAAIGNEVYFLSVESWSGTGSEAWVFNPDSGGTRRWFDAVHIATSVATGNYPKMLAGIAGYLWIAPLDLTVSYSSSALSVPVAAVDRGNPSWLTDNLFADHDSYLVTSLLDFGYPNLPKLFNKIVVDYLLGEGVNVKIDISYILTTRIQPAPVVVAVCNNTKTPLNLTNDILNTPKTGSTAIKWEALSNHSDDYDEMYIGIPKTTDQIELWMFTYTGSWAGSPSVPPHFNVDQISLSVLMYGSMHEFSPLGAFTMRYRYVGAFTVITLRFPGPRVAGGWHKGLFSEFYVPTVTDLDAYGELYWIRLMNNTVYTDPACVEGVELTYLTVGDPSKAELPTQNWTPLGTIQGMNDFDNTQKEISFPSNVIGNQIMLKFDFVGDGDDRPEIRRYELEWMPAPSNLKIVDFVAVAVNNIELLNMETENSAGYIAATLFSLAGSPATYVAALPWPAPVGHTARVIVSINQPGGFVPGLAFDSANPDGAEIPIRLDEV